MKEAIQPEGVARPAPPYSPVVVSGDLVYTAGQVGFDETGQLRRTTSRARPGRSS